jgi:hypothetical protein
MKPFDMPEVRLGDWVHYYAHDGADPAIGLVSQVGQRAVVLWVLSPGYGGSDRPSVHHSSDPGLEEYPEWKRYGTWEHKPRDPQIAILSEKVAALEKKISAIEPRKKGQ